MPEPKVVPLSGGFMITSIVGFLITAMYLFPNTSELGISQGWAFTFLLFFTIMFIASMISMTYGPDTAQLHVGGDRYRRIKAKSKKK